jgi:hypothetical protein
MSQCVRVSAVLLCLTALITPALAQSHRGFKPPLPPRFHPPRSLAQAAPQPAPAPALSKFLVATVTLADIGFRNGLRFANLGGRRQIFIAVPQGANLAASQLSLVLDDLAAHEAKRNIEVLLNDRSVAAIALDGKTESRVVRVPLHDIKPRDGFYKLAFVYGGAATQDRCIDVRYVGDSLTVRPETALELQFDPDKLHDVATIAALMPRDVSVLLPGRRLTASEFAAALTVGRSLAAMGRKPAFQSGYVAPQEIVDAAGRRHWSRGVVVIGSPTEVTGTVLPALNTSADGGGDEIDAIRVGGYPALLVSDGASVRAARLLGDPNFAAARSLTRTSVAGIGQPKFTGDRLSFDQLGLVPPSAEVYGRADIGVAIDTRKLPPNTKLDRLMLDILVAPDGAGQKAVVSIFVNQRLVASAVAAQGEPTHIDVPLSAGLVGTVANVRALVQRRSAQGDCRFEPQGYPAQILGSSAAILSPAGSARDFADMVAHWSDGIEVMVPGAAAERPNQYLGLLTGVVGELSAGLTPLSVKFVDSMAATTPEAPFLAVGAEPPDGVNPSVRFDRGRVAVTDRSGKTLLDLAGFASGAVAQLVSAHGKSGIWVHPLSADGSLPAPPELNISRGDVAFIDGKGVALAMSTARDTMIQVSYPALGSWMTVAERFRSWIIGAIWLTATVIFLFILQRMQRRRRRRSHAADE